MSKILRVFVSFLMLFSQNAPHFFELPAIPSGQEINLDERFELVWEEEFNSEGQHSASIGKWLGNNIYEEYNTYGVEWNENEYIFTLTALKQDDFQRVEFRRTPNILFFPARLQVKTV